MTTTIRFYTPEDGDRMQGNVLADFVVSVPVDEWNGTLEGRGRIITSSRSGTIAVIWPRHNGTMRYHATPQPHSAIREANDWILDRFNEWRARR